MLPTLSRPGRAGLVLPTRCWPRPSRPPAGLVCCGVPVGSTGTITCKATSAVLAAGQRWVVTFTVRQPAKAQTRQVGETSTVRAANPDPVTRNNTARLTTGL